MRTPLVSVQIDRSGHDGYTVAVSVHGDGPPTPPFTGGFMRTELPAVPPIAVDGAVDVTVLGRVGQRLYDLLAGCGLKAAWDVVPPGPLLLDIRDPDLAQIPWELLRDGPRRPFALRSAPAMRGRLPGTDTDVLAPVTVPVRLLVVVDSPTDDKVLQQIDEIEAIFAGLASVPCSWQVEVLRGPGEKEFYQAYEDLAPHVMHVIGHATPTWEGRALAMHPAGGDEWLMTAEYLVTTLPKGKTPRLVVLNACRTTDRSNAALRYARGLADALLDNGVAAVVSMQGDVASSAAAVFSGALYRSLAAAEPLDEAVAEARSVVAKAHGAEPRDWALPVLELRADPAVVMRQDLTVDPTTVIGVHTGFDVVRWMVDRAPQRRRFHGSPPVTGSDGLVFVTGAKEVGKTMLARSCAVSHAIAGSPVVYYSLDVLNVETADFLVGVVDAARLWLGQRAWQQCDATKAALWSLFAMPGAPPVPSDTTTTSFITMPRPRAAGGPAAEAYSMVTDLLGTLGKPGPLVLVLDHLGFVQDKSELLDGLLLPAAQGLLKNVSVIVVEQVDALIGIAGDRGRIPIPPERNIRLDTFPREQTDTLVREYLARTRPAEVADAVWDQVRHEMITWARDRMKKKMPKELQPVEIDLIGQQKQRMYGLRRT